MKTRAEAAKELYAEWKDSAVRWWKSKSAGGAEDQTSMWFAAVGIPAVLIGLALCPRITVAAVAAAWTWKQIEDRRK